VKPSRNGSANKCRAPISPSWARNPAAHPQGKLPNSKKGGVSAIIKLSSPETKDYWEIPVHYEDDAILAIEKPSRLLVSPDRYDPNRPNIMKLFHRDIARAAKWVEDRKITYLANAHRLDFETSGILLLAKTKPALINLANQFGSEVVRKVYLAVATGSAEKDEFDNNAKLGAHPVRIGLIRIDEKNGKKSYTAFEVIERFKGFTYIRCKPRSGRTHQIRVHLQHRGLPIVGDELYGGAPLLLSSLKRNYRLKPGRVEHPLINRVALHAHELSFKHPVTDAEVTVTSPLPHDMEVALKFLRRHAS
jgi:RluA family pseudouridine synthase